MRILELLEEPNSGLSSQRLVFLVWSLGTFFVWSYLCLTKKEFVVVGWETIGMTLSFMGGKVIQRFAENKTPVFAEDVKK